MELVEVTDSIAVRNRELADRVVNSSKSSVTRMFIAKSDDQEIAFVSLDFYSVHPEGPLASLYEIWVRRDLRNQGFGTQVVTESEDVVQREGFTRLSANPKPIDGGDESRLSGWYERLGFRQSEFEQYLVKHL